MTDADPLTPAEEEVRRLLVEARHTEPIPVEVAARLDRVLEGLAQEPARAAPVTQLARRRRRTASLLVAAAAVVAVGIGLNQVLTTSGEDTTASESADLGPADNGAIRGEADAPEATREDADSDGTAFARNRLVELRSGDFADDVRSARLDLIAGSSEQDARSPDRALRKACRTASWGAGTFVPVRYDGQPAVVVFRRPQGDTQVADLFLCGGTEPERSVTLPAP